MADHIQSGLNYHNSGKLQLAISEYEKALRRDPSQHAAAFYLGMALLESGNWQRAEGFLYAAVLMGHDNARYLQGYADVLAVTGKFDKSCEYYQKSLAVDGSNWRCRLNYGAALRDMQKLEEAVKEFQAVIQLNPQSLPAWNNLGNVRMDLGQYDQALSDLNHALSLDSQNVDVLANLAKLENETGQFTDAINHSRAALAIDTDHAGAWLQLGRGLMESGNLNEAQFALSKSARLAPGQPAPLALLGTLAENLGNVALAIDYWNQTLQLRPDHAYVLGHMASRLKSKTPLDLQDRMIQLAVDENKLLSDRERAACGLAHVYDSEGRFAEAVKWLDRSCQMREKWLLHLNQSYQHEQFESLVNQIQSIVFEPSINLDTVDSTRRMIFIVGMPRSGTSLVEQILSSHSSITGLGELTWLPEIVKQMIRQKNRNMSYEVPLEFSQADQISIRRSYLERLLQLNIQTPWVIDKLPDNYYLLNVIQHVFPDALVIKCNRDARDTAISLRFTRFASVMWNTLWSHLVQRYRIYQSLHHSIPVKSESQLIEIEYENVVEDLYSQISFVLTKLNLAWEESCDAFYRNQRTVITASSSQVRHPLYRSSVGRWKNYRFAYAKEFDQLKML